MKESKNKHEIHFEPSPRRVRVMVAGTVVADSRHVMLMRETAHPPVYYFPTEDVKAEHLDSTDHRTECQYRGTASHWSIRVGDRVAENAVWRYDEPTDAWKELDGYYAFYWKKVDHWFEEDDEVLAHPRDPYHRVDVRESSRHLRIVMGGTTVAETQRPKLLFETNFPTRYYIPPLDCRMELLTPNELITECPYKGEASYYTLAVGDKEYRDLVWYYRFPYPAVEAIRNMVCFYDEKVDEVWIDGELQK